MKPTCQFRIVSREFGYPTYAADRPLGEPQLSEKVVESHVYDHRDARETKLKYWRAYFTMHGFDPSCVTIENVEPVCATRAAEDFRSPVTQRDILLNGSRNDLIQWLIWNDPNGIWSDQDSAAEGYKPMTLEDAQHYMRKALGGSPCELKLADSTSIDFDPNLPAEADEEGCKEWLRNLCRDFGLGFHPDTPASEYRNREGLPLPPEVVKSLGDSLDRTFAILGDEVPYTICAEVGEEMLAQLVGETEERPIRQFPKVGHAGGDQQQCET